MKDVAKVVEGIIGIHHTKIPNRTALNSYLAINNISVGSATTVAIAREKIAVCRFLTSRVLPTKVDTRKIMFYSKMKFLASKI